MKANNISSHQMVATGVKVIRGLLIIGIKVGEFMVVRSRVINSRGNEAVIVYKRRYILACRRSGW